MAGMVLDGAIRDMWDIRRMGLTVYARSKSPRTAVGHYATVAKNVPVECAGVTVRPGDIIVADEDGVVVVPQERAADVLKEAQSIDAARERHVSVHPPVQVAAGSHQEVQPDLTGLVTRRLRERGEPDEAASCDRPDRRAGAVGHQASSAAQRGSATAAPRTPRSVRRWHSGSPTAIPSRYRSSPRGARRRRDAGLHRRCSTPTPSTRTSSSCTAASSSRNRESAITSTTTAKRCS